MNTNTSVGKYGEDRASEFLQRLGYQVIERNWRCNVGEIDIVARDQDCIVFAEVKTRTRVGFGHPFDAITSAKMQKMRQLVGEWCRAHEIASVQVRLDAISELNSMSPRRMSQLEQPSPSHEQVSFVVISQRLSDICRRPRSYAQG